MSKNTINVIASAATTLIAAVIAVTQFAAGDSLDYLIALLVTLIAFVATLAFANERAIEINDARRAAMRRHPAGKGR